MTEKIRKARNVKAIGVWQIRCAARPGHCPKNKSSRSRYRGVKKCWGCISATWKDGTDYGPGKRRLW